MMMMIFLQYIMISHHSNMGQTTQSVSRRQILANPCRAEPSVQEVEAGQGTKWRLSCIPTQHPIHWCRASLVVWFAPIHLGPLGELRLIRPIGASELPGVQVHDEVSGLGVPVPHFAFVAVGVVGHLVLLKRQVRALVARLSRHCHFVATAAGGGGGVAPIWRQGGGSHRRGATGIVVAVVVVSAAAVVVVECASVVVVVVQGRGDTGRDGVILTRSTR